MNKKLTWLRRQPWGQSLINQYDAQYGASCLSKDLAKSDGPCDVILCLDWDTSKEGDDYWCTICAQYLGCLWDDLWDDPRYKGVIGDLCKKTRFSEVARINYDPHWSDDDLAKDWKRIDKILKVKGIKYDSYDFDVPKHQIILYKWESEYSIA